MVNPSQSRNDEALKYLDSFVTAFGPGDGLQLDQETWARLRGHIVAGLRAMRSEMGPSATVVPVSNVAGETNNAGPKGDSRYPNRPVRREGEIPAPATNQRDDKYDERLQKLVVSTAPGLLISVLKGELLTAWMERDMAGRSAIPRTLTPDEIDLVCDHYIAQAADWQCPPDTHGFIREALQVILRQYQVRVADSETGNG